MLTRHKIFLFIGIVLFLKVINSTFFLCFFFCHTYKEEEEGDNIFAWMLFSSTLVVDCLHVAVVVVA